MLEKGLRASLSPEFEIVGRLGGGRFSTVFLAREPALQRLVAVKALHPDAANAEKSLKRFRREAMALAAISHPNVVSIYRVGEIEGPAPYLVMQYVRGRNLRERLKEDGPLDEVTARNILSAIAGALRTVHEHDLAHRDVRPASILCDRDSGRVLLADFGLAAQLASAGAGADRLTTTGHVITDSRFSSPEVLQGSEATAASDVYSLGVLGYHLLAGLGPYPGAGVRGQIRAHLKLDPLPLASMGVSVSDVMQEILVACLAKDPGDRPGTDDVIRALAVDAAAVGSAPASGEAPAGPPKDGAEEESPASARFQLRLLGQLDLTSPGGSVTNVLKQPKRLALLAYLALGAVSGYRRRDSLTELFWPDSDPDSARHSLRQALYVLRRELEGEVILTRGAEEVGIDPRTLQCDATRFEELVRAGRPRAALDSYEGDLMPGFYLDGTPEFERWLDVERLRLRRLAATAAGDLAREATASDELREAIRWTRVSVDLDPFNEGALHELITLLAARGDRAGALSAYHHFAHRLEDEYAAQPSSRTRELIERVRRSEANEAQEE